MKRAGSVFLALALAVSLLLAACAKPTASPTPTTPTGTSTPTPKASPTPTPKPTQAPTAAPRYGGLLRVVPEFAPRTIGYPGAPLALGDIASAFPALESLVGQESTGALAPKLATSWQLAPDGKSITFTLRKGVKFHDGTDYNAEAVKYNLTALQKVKAELRSITSMDVLDANSIRLNLSQYDNTVLSSLALVNGMASSPTAAETRGLEWAKLNPVGTGPFKFISFQPNVSLVYERFDAYWDKDKPYLDKLQFIYIADLVTQQLAFQKGEVDMLQNNTKAANDLKGRPGVVVRAGYRGSHGILVPDSKNADSPLANKKVREALEYAIDREAMVKALGYGFWEAAYQLAPSTVTGFNPDIKGRLYDPTRAKQLLAEAGYSSGVKITLYGQTAFSELFTLVQGQLRAVGSDAANEVMATARFASVRSGGWKNGLLYDAMGVDLNFAQTMQRVFSATSIYYPVLSKPSDLLTAQVQASLATDDNTRKSSLQQISKVAFNDALVVPLYTGAQAVLNKESVHSDFGAWSNILWKPAEAWLSQ
ncbi:MAG: hypothetical protein HY667_05875 [Chloroflexi bacterium]|nr:hypothetical protein [Chloroflexota bacterium]